MLAYGAVAVAPLVLVLLGSFRPSSAIVMNPVGLPNSLSVANYVSAWREASMSVYFANSLLVTTCAVLLALVLSTTVAHAFARWTFAGRGVLIALVLAGCVIPARVGLLPLFHLFESWGLINSRVGLILLYSAEAIPFSVLILMAFLRGLPVELEEAAQMDGASSGRIFWSVILPQLRPSLAVVAVFEFAPIWNDFFYPLVFLRDTEKYTVPVGLTQFFGQFSTDRGVLFAGLAIALTPLVLLFVFLTRHIVSGLTAGMGR
ncbi:carbohydrate ABC transporter permease [Spirillospora sp. CA-255316]